MDVLQFLNTYWFMIISGIGTIAWGVRLEAKQHALKVQLQMHAETTDKMWIKFDSIQHQMTGVLQGVSRIDGRLDEMRRRERDL